MNKGLQGCGSTRREVQTAQVGKCRSLPFPATPAAFYNFLKDLGRARIVVEVRHIEGDRNHLADILSRVVGVPPESRGRGSGGAR